MKYFAISSIITVIGLALSYYIHSWEGMAICALLILMEVSLSFDNAVVNAAVLKNMDAKWQRRFLTWGMVIAVFGVRFILPLVIVAFATGIAVWDVTKMAWYQPEEYSRHVLASHVQIGAFGGMFLLMVFLKFILDENKDLHWIVGLERRLVKLGKLEAIEIMLALSALLGIQFFLEEQDRLPAMVAGVVGIVLYVLVNGLAALVSHADQEGPTVTHMVSYSGMMGFIYLQFLDASFSLDGVIGAFAISKDVIIIMIGLGVGAFFVRSLTVYLVHKGTLDHYRYLEHGAHYGIGALSAIMLISMLFHVPEVVTGVIGFTFIALSLISSIKYNKAVLLSGKKR